MLTFLKNKVSLSIININLKTFAQKQNLTRFRKQIETFHNKDFTKSHSVNDAIDKKIEDIKKRMPVKRLSKTLKTMNPRELSFSPVVQFPANRKKFNNILRKGIVKTVKDIEDEYTNILESRLFNKDHTAAILENVRKGIENKIFNRKLHYLKEKSLALKMANRKKKYLINNYTERFLNYENYNDTKNVQNHRGKSLIDFSHIMLPMTNLDTTPKYTSSHSNKLLEYQNNKNQLTNNRIDVILKFKNSNPVLEKLLLSEDTETSLIKVEGNNSQIKTSSDDSTSLVYKDNENLPYFNNDIITLQKIENFELEEYKEWKEMDLYNRHGGRVKFSEMTLQENLNYVKFYIKNSLELFKMFHELKKKKDVSSENDMHIIYTSILHKLAYSINRYSYYEKILNFLEYKSLLQSIKPHFNKLDNKNLVDTLWSIGKIHSYKRDFSPKFFNYFLKEIFEELKQRIEYLNQNEIAFLCEGLSMLRERSENVTALSNMLYSRIIKLKDSFTIYQLSKVINYYHLSNHSSLDDLLIYVGESLSKCIKEEVHQIRDELNYKDIIRLIDAYSFAEARHRTYNFFITESDLNELQKTMNPEENQENRELITADNKNSMIEKYKYEQLRKFSKNILEGLALPIISMRKELLFKQAAKILSIYSNSNILIKDVYLYLEKQINDLVETGHDFDIIDIMNTTWGLSKLNTKNIFPDYHLDVNLVIYPSFHEKLNSLKFITFERFADKIFEKKNFLKPKYLSLICYNLSLMGYANLDFYLPVYHNIKLLNREKPINLEDSAYFFQALSMLNYNDKDLLSFLMTNFITNSKDFTNFKKDFSLAQFCSASVMLNSQYVLKSIRFWDRFLEKLNNYTKTCYTEQHIHYYISVIWFFTYLESVDKQHLEKFIELLEKIKSNNYLTKYDKVILGQILLQNKKLLPKDYVNPYLSDLLKFEREKGELQVKVLNDANLPLVNKIFKKLINQNSQYFSSEGFSFVYNLTVDDAYIIPIVDKQNKICILFYDHGNILKDQTVSGYNIIKERYLNRKGYSVCRIYHKEFSDNLQLNYDNENKILETIVEKLKNTLKIKIPITNKLNL